MEIKIVNALAKEHYYKVTFKKEISTLELTLCMIFC